MGRPRQLGFVAMSEDVAAADATCCRVIGLDPRKIPYLAEARHFLGNIDVDLIEQRGERPERYATAFDVIDNFKSLRLPQ